MTRRAIVLFLIIFLLLPLSLRHHIPNKLLKVPLPTQQHVSKIAKPWYGNDTDMIFWFVHVTDIHIGWSGADAIFNDFCNDALPYIDPYVIVATGDLTDSVYTGQSVDQWTTYRNAILNAGYDNETWWDIPGNHDGYGDSDTFSYFLTYSITGASRGDNGGIIQYDWKLEFSFGTYYFFGLNTVVDDGSQWPAGTNAELTTEELDWLENKLQSCTDANLTIVMGHHPHYNGNIPSATSSQGHTLMDMFELYGVDLYLYGHNHENEVLYNDDTILIQTASLGKSNKDFTVFAVDHDGLAWARTTVDSWPVLIVTAPLDIDTHPNPYKVPHQWEYAPIRALVFDKVSDVTVEWSFDGTTWHPMTEAREHVYVGYFNASLLTPGQNHTITVRVTSSSGTKEQTVKFYVDAEPEVVGAIPTQEHDEDSSPWYLDLTPYESDLEDSGEDLRWSVIYFDPLFCSVEVVNVSEDLIKFTPYPNAYGSRDIILGLSDSLGQTVTVAVTVILNPVNDPPQISSIPTQEYPEDSQPWILSLKNYVQDIDNSLSELTFIITGGNDSLCTYEFHGGSTPYIEFFPVENAYGEMNLTITVSDPDGCTDTATIKVIIDPVNDPPIILPIEQQIRASKDPWSIDLSQYEEDIDNSPDELYWEVEYDEAFFESVEIVGKILTFDPRENASGETIVILHLYDGAGGHATYSLSVVFTFGETAIEGMNLWIAIAAVVAIVGAIAAIFAIRSIKRKASEEEINKIVMEYSSESLSILLGI